MIHLQSYGKILSLGSNRTENALIGDVIIQEKIDGSQIKFMVDEDGELLISSKSAPIVLEMPDKMFAKGVEYIVSIKDRIPRNIIFYGEYLQKSKHNVLSYERTPKNNIILFDVLENGKFVDRTRLEELANLLDLDVIPELYKGIADVEKIKELLGTKSILGNEILEGVVIKNYGQNIILGGQVFTLMCKYVREEFKERHKAEWKDQGAGFINEFKLSFKTEARWIKAVQHLAEKGLLENSPKDIGNLMKEVHIDLIQEESENIKQELYNHFIKDIKRIAVHGLPEWYKDRLLQNLEIAEELQPALSDNFENLNIKG